MPVLLLFKGHPGSGKSSICKALSRTLKWPLIDKDDFKDILVSQPVGIADDDANLAAYRIMFRMAQTQLENGVCSILDSPLARVELYHQALDAAPEGTTVIVVECACADERLWKKRLEERAKLHSSVLTRHKPSGWKEIQTLLQRYDGCEAWTEDPGLDLRLLKIDTACCAPEEGAQLVIEYLKYLKKMPAMPLDDPLFLMSG